jgi:hypothetical protein
MPTRAVDQRQLLLPFPEKDIGGTQPSTLHQHRRTAAEKVLAMLPRTPEAEPLRKLLETGQILPGNQVPDANIIQFVLINRARLKQFVQMIANGGYARDVQHEEAAWALLQDFDALEETVLAQRLADIGCADSTQSFGRAIGPYRYLLFQFREVMKKALSIPLTPPSPAQSGGSSPLHTLVEANEQ